MNNSSAGDVQQYQPARISPAKMQMKTSPARQQPPAARLNNPNSSSSSVTLASATSNAASSVAGNAGINSGSINNVGSSTGNNGNPGASYRIGENLRSPSHSVSFSSLAQATILLSKLPINSPIYVKRTNRQW